MADRLAGVWREIAGYAVDRAVRDPVLDALIPALQFVRVMDEVNR